MRRVVKRTDKDEKLFFAKKKYSSLCSHLKLKCFNFSEIFLQRNQSDFFLESRGYFTRIENFSQNGRLTALSGLRKDRPQYILKARIIELQTSFRLRHIFFAGTLRKWILIFLPRYFFLTKNSVSDRRKVWMEIRLKNLAPSMWFWFSAYCSVWKMLTFQLFLVWNDVIKTLN